MSGKIEDGKTQLRDTNQPRKTMKILSGTRFQWIAYDTETKKFMGTGGGTYTTANGDYPSDYDGVSDTERSVAIAFNVLVDDTPTDPVTPSEPPAGGSSGGGSIDLSWLVLLLMAGVVIRRRDS